MEHELDEQELRIYSFKIWVEPLKNYIILEGLNPRYNPWVYQTSDNITIGKIFYKARNTDFRRRRRRKSGAG